MHVITLLLPWHYIKQYGNYSTDSDANSLRLLLPYEDFKRGHVAEHLGEEVPELEVQSQVAVTDALAETYICQKHSHFTLKT